MQDKDNDYVSLNPDRFSGFLFQIDYVEDYFHNDHLTHGEKHIKDMLYLRDINESGNNRYISEGSDYKFNVQFSLKLHNILLIKQETT